MTADRFSAQAQEQLVLKLATLRDAIRRRQEEGDEDTAVRLAHAGEFFLRALDKLGLDDEVVEPRISEIRSLMSAPKVAAK
jgi:hypothetical protein